MRLRQSAVMVGIAVTVIVALVGFGVAPDAVKLDPALKPYQVVSAVSGNLSSVGSDTLNNLMTLWAETFYKFYPNVKIQIEGKGSTTAPRSHLKEETE